MYFSIKSIVIKQCLQLHTTLALETYKIVHYVPMLAIHFTQLIVMILFETIITSFKVLNIFLWTVIVDV